MTACSDRSYEMLLIGEEMTRQMAKWGSLGFNKLQTFPMTQPRCQRVNNEYINGHKEETSMNKPVNQAAQKPTIRNRSSIGITSLDAPTDETSTVERNY